MEKYNFELIKELFNIGKLTLAAANFYEIQNWQIVCHDGKVEYIYKSDEV